MITIPFELWNTQVYADFYWETEIIFGVDKYSKTVDTYFSLIISYSFILSYLTYVENILFEKNIPWNDYDHYTYWAIQTPRYADFYWETEIICDVPVL